MSYIAIVSSDPMLGLLLHEVLSLDDHVVHGSAIEPRSHTFIREVLPDLALIEVGEGRAAAGWPLLDRLHADPQTRHVPVIAYSVDQRNLAEQAPLLDAYGYSALPFPSTVNAIRAAIAEVVAMAPPPSEMAVNL